MPVTFKQTIYTNLPGAYNSRSWTALEAALIANGMDFRAGRPAFPTAGRGNGRGFSGRNFDERKRL